MATDERFDELISTWLQETAPAQIPARVLEEAARQTRASRQQVGWRGLLRILHATRSILVLGATAAIVVAAVLVLSPRVVQPDVGELPTTPDAWSLASIDSPWATAQVDGLVAGPRGLLAILGELGSHDMQLSVSTDGRTWTLVPNDQFPSAAVLLPPGGSRHLPAVVTTDGFLFVADGNDVWASEDGYTWQRRADRAQDPELRAGQIHAVAAGGPGLIAVGGDNAAWYSEDGSDWTLAEVPSPPTVDMTGVAVAGDTLIAWGNPAANNEAGFAMVEPVLWTSDDGRSWEKVLDVSGVGWLQDVAAGPDGLVAIGDDPTGAGGIWFSADGRAWQPAAGFDDAGSPAEVNVSSIAATSSGYVAVGDDGVCDVEPCPGARAVIWTSPDGRSWSRLQRDDRFEVADPRTAANHSGAWATSAVAWDSHFVVAGAYDASPVIWISGTPDATEAPIVNPTHSETPPLRESASPAPQSSEQVAQPTQVANVTDLLNAFLEARVAGEGAEEYLLPVSGDSTSLPPLLYATTSGAPYERAEFEPVPGIEWPYGWTAFKVRLFAGDTVVEQLLFWAADDPQRLKYNQYGFATDIAPTTEDGQPVALPYSNYDGAVTVHASYPWIQRAGNGDLILIPAGMGPTTDGGQRSGWDRLVFMADPARTGTDCPTGPAPTDAEALAASIRSDPDFEATAPVAVGAAGAEGLAMDVVAIVGASAGCGGLLGDGVLLTRESVGLDTGNRVRLYLFDAPEESSIRLLAIAISVPESRFERAVEWAAPIVEFHAP